MSVIWICRWQVGKLGHDDCGKVICGKAFTDFSDVVEHFLVKHAPNWHTGLDEIAKNIYASSTGMNDNTPSAV